MKDESLPLRSGLSLNIKAVLLLAKQALENRIKEISERSGEIFTFITNFLIK